MSKGRQFDVQNKRYPVAVMRLRDKRLPCFTPAEWDEWLLAEWRAVLDNEPKRASMARGNFPCPCLDCTASHEVRMKQQNLCAPADPGMTPTAKSKATA